MDPQETHIFTKEYLKELEIKNTKKPLNYGKETQSAIMNGEIFFDPQLNEFTPNFSVMDGLTGFGLYLIARKFPESQSWNTFMLLD